MSLAKFAEAIQRVKRGYCPVPEHGALGAPTKYSKGGTCATCGDGDALSYEVSNRLGRQVITCTITRDTCRLGHSMTTAVVAFTGTAERTIATIVDHVRQRIDDAEKLCGYSHEKAP